MGGVWHWSPATVNVVVGGLGTAKRGHALPADVRLAAGALHVTAALVLLDGLLTLGAAAAAGGVLIHPLLRSNKRLPRYVLN